MIPCYCDLVGRCEDCPNGRLIQSARGVSDIVKTYYPDVLKMERLPVKTRIIREYDDKGNLIKEIQEDI